VTEINDRHQRLRAIFDEALTQEPSTLEAYLDRASEGDPDLRAEVMRLLAAHGEVRAFLEHPPNLPPAASADEEFGGTARFSLVRQVGAGGMGAVYEVHDSVRNEVVALKTLLRASAAGLYRLKREFRSLVDVTHPNLVCLYELFVEDDRCFFTMELVRGLNFVDYARESERGHRFTDRLIPALRQLIDGVSALHQRGKLHRDIKPSNVLVTREGRVMILDFGLITELLPQHEGEIGFAMAGTPAYMSPEQASGAPPSEASDWYGVGVTLYEALTGRTPFSGAVHDVLHRKRIDDPLPPSEAVPDVPRDLSAICMGLLCRNPERRLTGSEVLRRLAPDTAHPASDTTPSPIRDPPFVGRDRQLEALNDAFRSVSEGRAAAVSVFGPSGIGKSALVRRFLSQLRARDDTIALCGRCYENESIPYKAVDGVIDDLSRYLGSIPRQQTESLMAPGVGALTRVFPVLLQVDAIANARRDHEPVRADPLGLRQQAFEALRGLLSRLAKRQPLVISIDDLQWADADSAVLLEELLRPPGSPAMLTLFSFRSEETAAKPFLQRLLERADRDMWSAISLEPMPDDEAHALIEVLLPTDSALTDHDKRRMSREACGSPFVLEQLARYAGVNRMEPTRAPTFAEMFETRLDALSADARRFLETLAICRRPMAPEIICDACGVARERQSFVAMLRSSHFIRSSGSSERIETYHDRIREVLAAQVAPDAMRRIHGLMVRALVERRSDDCEALFEHYRGAGDVENASIQAGLSAAKAGAALAFDRAAFFYRHALALAPAPSAAHAWREALANALANAGRPADAAEAYLSAASRAGHPRRVELQRRAAEQFLIGGHIDRGLDLIRTELASLGMHPARSPRAALFGLVWRRLQLRWRGLGFVSRTVEDIDANVLLRVDTCWAATTGLALVDMISASDFSARHLLMALAAGEPSRVARAMAFESAARAAYPTGRKMSERLVQQSKSLAKSVAHPHVVALSILADGIGAMTAGEWKKALTLSEQALAILREQCVGVTWELNMAQNSVVWALMYLGELREVSRQVPALVANARSRGNLYLATELCTRSNYAWLAADEPDEGEREAVNSIEQWSHQGFHRLHYSAMLAQVQTALYRGNAEAAWRLFAEKESMIRRSYLTGVQLIRIESLYLRARGALAMVAWNNSSRRFLSVARAAARRIARERMPWSNPIALLIMAAVAYLEGSTPSALGYLHDAADRFDRADMALYAAVARRRIGELQDDAPGRELWQRANEWMAAQTIKNPACMTRMLAPGFPDAAST
jgi:serine/threonine protein kinase/tetratricopeptide (TPR) repeat protein